MKKKGLPGNPIMVEVIALMLTVQMEKCKNCRLLFEDTDVKRKFADKEANEYPDDMKLDALHLSNWIRELAQRYSQGIQIKVIDAASPLGFYKSLRYRIREFPTFIINNRQKYSGWKKKGLEAILDQHFEPHPSVPQADL